MRSRPLLALALAASLLAGCARERGDVAGRLLTARTLGLAYLETGRLEEAGAQFKTVIALAPGEALGYANLALTYLGADRLEEAEAQALRAVALDSTTAEVALALAGVYAAQQRGADARAVLERPVRAGNDAPALLYALAQVDTSAIGADARVDLLQRVLRQAPTNLAARLDLLDLFVARGEADSATRALEEIRRLPPEPPREVLAPYRTALASLRAGRLADARAPLARFREALELTPPYQASLAAVRGPMGPMAGRPVLGFSSRLDLVQRATKLGQAIENAVLFQDATADLGIGASGDSGAAPARSSESTAVAAPGGALAVGDYDGDGTDDILVPHRDAVTGVMDVRLYRIANGAAEDVTAKARVALAGGMVLATFVDTDNDGWLDLFAIGTDGHGHLLRNTGRARFEDRSMPSGLSSLPGVRRARFVDIDHDGDLDLVTVGMAGVRAMRNDGAGTFVDATVESGLQDARSARDVVFADFDDDGRIDLFVSHDSAGGTLFRNVGARRFEDATVPAGLETQSGAGAVAVGDFDNDGDFDLLLAAADTGGAVLWRNGGDGTFAPDREATAALAPLRALRASAIRFVDYDNDGWLDVVATGVPTSADAPAVVLLRNDRAGRFVDRSDLVPRTITGGAALVTFDFGLDGDEDFVVSEPDGRPHVLRNVGGNANLFMQVRLTGLRTGSGKNNTFGIGSKVELRVGDMVQTRVMDAPMLNFGLGAHLKADVLRVEWTNGVPQVILFPGSDQDVLENEVLKSSCGFLYAWDGSGYRFVTDVMWRSALGMPLGIMGSNTAWAPAGASQEYLRLPGSALQARDGRYLLQLTEELWETSYTDEVRLIAVDHPDSVDMFVDERFIPPGPVTLRLYQAARAQPPRSAVDDRGNDLLPALRDHDDRYVSNLLPAAYQGLVESHDLVMDLGEDAGAAGTYLFLRGWIYPTDASINVALSQQSRLKPVMPALEVRDAAGAWRTVAEIGFPSGKDKTIVVDLAGRFPTNDHHVRIRTNMQIYWDQAFVATDGATPATLTTVPLLSADLHFRGTSRTYRKGGLYGPHWFDYDSVVTEPVWRPITGAFTRYGDVLPLLRSADDMYIVMSPGDETTLAFDAGALPALAAGWTRDFLLYSDGWIKDADMNTALGNTVGPLPFHAVRAYPYAPGEQYPTDAAHQRFLREYNTRVVRRR